MVLRPAKILQSASEVCPFLSELRSLRHNVSKAGRIELRIRFLFPFVWAATATLGLWGQQAQPVIVFNDDGGWCWFEDERAIVYKDKLLIGSVAAGVHESARCGNIELVTYDLSTGSKRLEVLHPNLSDGPDNRYDDHNSPVFLARPDGRILTVYAEHDLENHFYYRISAQPGDPTAWRPERTFVPSETSGITYSNLLWLGSENGGKGRIYDFFRGLDGRNKPSYAWSDDEGETWKAGNVFIDVPGQFLHRPYVKYVSNGADTMHMFYTDGHPNEFRTNSNYHACYRDGEIYKSDGARIRKLTEGLKDPAEGTRIFPGNAENIAWTSDIHLDREGRPFVAYTVRKSPAGTLPEHAGEDHRYHYARWNGKSWIDHEIAYAGSCLYRSELDYTGNITLDPGDADTVYISTNVQPKSGKPLRSRADGRQHFEIFKGTTTDGGASWSWDPITANSAVDNLRPLVPIWPGNRVVLLWLRGIYRAYTDYDLSVVGVIAKRQQMGQRR